MTDAIHESVNKFARDIVALVQADLFEKLGVQQSRPRLLTPVRPTPVRPKYLHQKPSQMLLPPRPTPPTEAETEAYQVLRKHGAQTSHDVARRLLKGETTARYYLKGLVQKGVVRRRSVGLYIFYEASSGNSSSK